MNGWIPSQHAKIDLGKTVSQHRPEPRWVDFHWHPRRDVAGKRLWSVCGVDRLNRDVSPTNARITHSAKAVVDVESTEGVT